MAAGPPVRANRRGQVIVGKLLLVEEPPYWGISPSYFLPPKLFGVTKEACLLSFAPEFIRGLHLFSTVRTLFSGGCFLVAKVFQKARSQNTRGQGEGHNAHHSC